MNSRTELLRFMNSLLFQQFAATYVDDSHHNEHHACSYENDVQHDSSPIKISLYVDHTICALEFHHDRHIDKRFVFAQIRKPHAAGPATTSGLRGPQARLAGCTAAAAREVLGITVISAGRWDSPSASPIRHARMAIIVLPAKSDVLLWHIVKRHRRVPCLKRISGILRKVRRISGRRDGALSVDRRQQYQIPSRIVDLSAA